MIRDFYIKLRTIMKYNNVKNNLLNNQKTWLVTGVAGFIGSNLAEALLKLNQKVISLDNFSTGHKHNLSHIKESVRMNNGRTLLL